MSIFIRTFACMKKMILHTNLVTTIKALLHVVSLLSAPLLLTAAILMAACSGDDSTDTNDTPTPTNDNSEIQLNADVWRVMEGTRATTYDNATGLQTAGFKVYAYERNTTTPYLDGLQVDYSDGWAFNDGKQYWPDYALDFFAHAPSTVPNYITSGPTYTATASPSVTHDVTFACTLDNSLNDQNSDVKEFIYALALDQDKAGTNTSTQAVAGQVALTFQHPFARIYLKRGTIRRNGESVVSSVVRISRVTLKSVNKTGTYSYNNGTPSWGSLGNSTSYILDEANVPTEGNGPYLVVPQTFNSTNNFSVQLTYRDGWGVLETQEFETTVNTTWEPGHSYTYTISASITVSEGGGGGGSSGGITVDVNKYTEQW